MSKLSRSERAPAFQIYASDVLGDLAGIGALEAGIYFRLALHSWRLGGLPREIEQMCDLAHVSQRDVSVLRRILANHFVLQRGRYVLPWQEAQRKEREAFSASRKRAADTRWERERQLALDMHPDSTSNARADHVQSSAVNSSMQSADAVAVEETERASEYPPWFDAWWSEYPKRDGTNSKRDAYKAVMARRHEGERPEVLHEGLLQYRAWCEARAIVGTSVVMTAARFFGPAKHYRDLDAYMIDAPQVPRGNGAKPLGLEAQNAFDQIIKLAEPTAHGTIYRVDRIEKEIGKPAVAAFKAVGGRDAFRSRDGESEQFLRRNFERYYTEAKQGKAT